MGGVGPFSIKGDLGDFPPEIIFPKNNEMVASDVLTWVKVFRFETEFC